MPTTEELKSRLSEQHSIAEIPRTNKNTFGRGKTFVDEDDNTTLLLSEGDVLWHEGKNEFSILLGVKESTGVIHFNLSQLYYGYIPADFVLEDYNEGRIQILEDPFNLKEK